MIKVENIEVFNLEGALRGMRNPLNSWKKSDSHYCEDWATNLRLDCKDTKCEFYGKCLTQLDTYLIGENDLQLMQKLYNAGTEHSKYLRQIMVSMDITAPRYWWAEADTYKVGTVRNSCSTMHKLTSKKFTKDDFSQEYINKDLLCMNHISVLIDLLNQLRYEYLHFDEIKPAEDITQKDLWYAMIQLLPASYNQKATLTMSYANVMSMINQRENHKLDEWRQFVKVLRSLPYVNAIRGEK